MERTTAAGTIEVRSHQRQPYEEREDFVLQDEASRKGTTVAGRWWVVPGSATGELAGLRGEGGSRAEQGQNATWTVDYWFEP